MPNKYLFILTYSGFILCLFRYKFGDKPFIPILTVYLFISTYSGFILCLFWYKFGDKPFIPILTVTHWVTVKIGINGLAPDLYLNKHRINPEYLEINFYLLGMAGHAE
jgi:hypothetical protein